MRINKIDKLNVSRHARSTGDSQVIYNDIIIEKINQLIQKVNEIDKELARLKREHLKS